MLRRAALKALARCQARQSKWSRYDLIHELGSVMPPQVRDLAPERMLPLLEDLADRALAGEFEPVVCLEAPELVDVPESLRRADGLAGVPAAHGRQVRDGRAPRPGGAAPGRRRLMSGRRWLSVSAPLSCWAQT